MVGFQFGIKDIIDILLVALIMYEMFRLLRRSGAVNLFWGILAFVIAWFLVTMVFQLELTGALFDRIISVGAIALIVIFQEEIRGFRPDYTEEEAGKAEAFLTTSYNDDRGFQPFDMGDLLMSAVPNTGMKNLELTLKGGNERNENYLEAVENELQKRLQEGIQEDRSPVALRFNGHYYTVTGIEGDIIFLKEPRKRGAEYANPNISQVMRISEIVDAVCREDEKARKKIAASGKREDHTIGNLSLLMEYTRCFDLGDKRVDMVSDWGTIFAITDSCTLDVGEGRRFSLISPDNTLRVKSEGLQWKTDDVVFDNWWKATLNRATRDRVSLEFSHPSMALVFLD